jgi:hypothetical protein
MLSVTQVLDAFPEADLISWKLRVGPKKADEISQEALRAGSLVDGLIQRQFRQQTFEPPVNDLPVLNAWGAWQLWNEQHPTFFASITTIQEELTDGELVGHPDLTCARDGGWGTVSIKCASRIRPVYWTQEAAYAVLRGIQYPTLGFPRFLGILRLDKQTGQPEYQELTNPKEIRYEMEGWRHYLWLYQHWEIVKSRTISQQEEEVLGCSIA